jgi:hypothetical protein
MAADYERQTLSFEEAEAIARRDSKRILQVDRGAISYVHYDPSFFNYYRKVSIEFDDRGRGRMSWPFIAVAASQIFVDR